MTNLIPKEEPKKMVQEDDYMLTKLQTDTSLKPTRSRRSSAGVNNDDASPIMMRRRRQSSFRRASDTSNDAPRDIRIFVPDGAQHTDQSQKTKNEEEEKEKLPIILRIRYGIWKQLQLFTKYEFKFALKMAVAVIVLSIPAFVPSSVDWYYNIRGQWAPMTVIAIMNPTRYVSHCNLCICRLNFFFLF